MDLTGWMHVHEVVPYCEYLWNAGCWRCVLCQQGDVASGEVRRDDPGMRAEELEGVGGNGGVARSAESRRR